MTPDPSLPLVGPRARLFRIVNTTSRVGYRVETWDRHGMRWRLWGYERGKLIAANMVRWNIAEWVA